MRQANPRPIMFSPAFNTIIFLVFLSEGNKQNRSIVCLLLLIQKAGILFIL